MPAVMNEQIDGSNSPQQGRMPPPAGSRDVRPATGKTFADTDPDLLMQVRTELGRQIDAPQPAIAVLLQCFQYEPAGDSRAQRRSPQHVWAAGPGCGMISSAGHPCWHIAISPLTISHPDGLRSGRLAADVGRCASSGRTNSRVLPGKRIYLAPKIAPYPHVIEHNRLDLARALCRWSRAISGLETRWGTIVARSPTGGIP